ncbi:MAG: CoA-binding protein, partial [Thermoproteota archaeon]
MLLLDKFFYPDSIAVIGASRKPGKVGHEILRILKENKDKGIFRGELYAVNPDAREILGVTTYPSISQLPSAPDLAVIAIPAKFVPGAVDELGKLGTKNVVVVSGGFAEIGGEGVALQEQLVEVAKKHGIRLVGPNCIGILCPETGVDTMFLPYEKEIGGKVFESLPRPKPGSISLITQSGAFGVACLDYMAGEKLGLAKFVSYGNRADVDEAELIDYLASDYKTRVILVYIESLGRGKEFIEAARRAILSKPIVVLKAARTKAGTRAAVSHTAAMAGRDDVYDAAFRQAGIIRVNNVEELFDVAKALSMQPPAKGKRIAVLTDGGGAGVMAVDELESRGQIIADLSGETEERLEEV